MYSALIKQSECMKTAYEEFGLFLVGQKNRGIDMRRGKHPFKYESKGDILQPLSVGGFACIFFDVPLRDKYFEQNAGDGGRALARSCNCCFYLMRDLVKWAILNEELWGNPFGNSMFSHPIAYGFTPDTVTAKGVGEHFLAVAKRCAEYIEQLKASCVPTTDTKINVDFDSREVMHKYFSSTADGDNLNRKERRHGKEININTSSAPIK